MTNDIKDLKEIVELLNDKFSDYLNNTIVKLTIKDVMVVYPTKAHQLANQGWLFVNFDKIEKGSMSVDYYSYPVSPYLECFGSFLNFKKIPFDKFCKGVRFKDKKDDYGLNRPYREPFTSPDGKHIGENSQIVCTRNPIDNIGNLNYS